MEVIRSTRHHMLSTRVIYSLAFYLLSVALLYVSKPPIAFNQDGSIKPFGVGEGYSIFSLGVLVSVVSIVCFYAFCLVDVVFGQ